MYNFWGKPQRKKYRPSDICKEMQKLSYKQSKIHHHTRLWQDQEAKHEFKGYGVEVAGAWYWYESWLHFVKQHCEQNQSQYR
jgi:hypothetical protein